MRNKVFLILLCLMLASSYAYARSFQYGDTGTLGNDEILIDSDGDIIPVDDSARTVGESGSEFANIYTDAITLGGQSLTGTRTKEHVFGIGDMILNDGSSVELLTEASVPGLELDNLMTSVVWADGELTPVSVTFEVPSDYVSDGSIGLFCDEATGDGTPCRVDFSVYVNREGTLFDAATSNQTPVALIYDPGTPDMVLLTVATDFDSLAANDSVTLLYWRDNTAGIGTGDLENYYGKFIYTGKD